MIRFNVDNNLEGKKDDTKITVNGIVNKLTNPGWKYYNNNTSFEYTITTNQNDSLDSLEICFGKGHYKISDICCYVADYPHPDEEISPFEADKEKTAGDTIYGSIDVAKDGYFNISVPYSEGFSVKVDGEETECEMTDTSFLGFKVSEGQHRIEITFTSPLRKEGIIMSLSGIVVFAVMTVYEIVKSKRKSVK